MNFGNQHSEKQKGKRTSGFSTRKEGEFSIGWNVDNQLNDFQLKRQDKANNMASKVTQAPLQQNKQQFEYNSALTLEQKCRELLDEYPNITTEQLHQRLALWELSNKQVNKQPQTNQKKTGSIKQVDSVKNALYGGENIPEVSTQQRVSRRNEGTFSLGDGYNYFKDQNNKR